MQRSRIGELDYAFGQTMLTLRSAIGLTQESLATRLGVSRHSVKAWESGSKYPSADHLKAFVELAVAQRAFHAGRESEEIRALWRAAHQKVLLDEDWLKALAGTEAPNNTVRDVPPARAPAGRGPRTDWGDALSVPTFYGRAWELGLLREWIVDERCRVVGVQGMGGIGKSALTVTLTHQLVEHFDVVIWRSARDAPSVETLLDDWLQHLDPQSLGASSDQWGRRLSLLLDHLRRSRVLLVLDNLETLLEERETTGQMRPGYAGYAELLRRIAETEHQSCLVFTSREKPGDLVALEGSHSPVRVLRLARLDAAACGHLLDEHGLRGSAVDRGRLVETYAGNPLALKIVARTIVDLFDGEIAPFLAQGEAIFGGVRGVLEEQFDRLSPFEQSTLLWLATLREPATLDELAARRVVPERRARLLEAVQALLRRSLVERGQKQASFTLQSVVLEYATERLVSAAAREIETGQLSVLREHALVLATASDYVRRTQERLVATPVLDQLRGIAGPPETVERRLLGLLDGLRGQDSAAQGYGPGNLVNLLRLLRGNLRGLDLSNVAIRQACLAEVEAQDARLVDAHLAETVLSDAFSMLPCVALSGDGAYLAAGTAMGEIYLWRRFDRALLRTIRGHAGMTLSVALSDRGERVASSSDDGTVKLWDAHNGQLLQTFGGLVGAVPTVALSGDGRRVAAGDFAGSIRVWDADDGRTVSSIAGWGEAIWGIALDATGTRVAAAYGSTVQVWEAGSGRSIATLEGHGGGHFSVSLSVDGGIVASGSFDGNVRVWRVDSGQLIAILPGHVQVWSVALSAAGDRLVCGGFDGTVRLWDVVEERLVTTLAGHTGGVRGVAIDRDGNLLASASYDGTAKLWQSDGRLQSEFRGYSSAIRAVALSASGRWCASASFDRTVRLWDIDQNRLVTTFVGHTGGVWAVAMSRDGHLIVSAGDDGAVRLWRADRDQPVAVLQGHTGAIWSVAVSEDKRTVFSGSLDGTIRSWDTDTGAATAVFDSRAGPVWAIAASRDGSLLASGGATGVITLWDVPSRSVRAILNGHTSTIWGLARSGDGQFLVSASFDATARLWDTRGGECLGVLEGHTGGVWSAAVSDDGRLLATAGFDGIIRLWDARTRQCLASAHGHDGGIWSLAFDEDARILASAGVDGTIAIWDVASAARLQTLRRDRIYERLDITGLTGITAAQRAALLALGAVEVATGAEEHPGAR